MTDSSIGGFLQPFPVPAPLQGQALNRFIQQWIVNLSGLPGASVRPRWQVEPADIPNAGDAWAAIGVTGTLSDTYPAVVHISSAKGRDQLRRNETLSVLCSFYDLGTNGLADTYASLTRDNGLIGQNREYLGAQGFKLIEMGTETTVPSLLKQRWLYRVDLPLALRRQVTRDYAVLNLLEATGEVVTDQGVTAPFNAKIGAI